jgi:uncharacterized protein (DUF1501 family)
VDALTRRRFLVRSGVAAGTAIAAGAAGYTIWDLLATAGDPASGPGGRTLVLVTLYGGNDGLATVIPYADPAYHDARPGLSYNAGEVLRLDDATGLNPGLRGLHREYGSGRLAIIRGVGYPKPDRSHFRSMDIWQTANPVRPEHTGWLGRWLDAAGGDPRLAVSFEPVLPPVLAGAHSAGACVSVGGLTLPKGIPNSAVAALSRPALGESPLQARAAGSFADLLEIDKMITDVSAQSAADEDADDDEPTATGTGGARTPLAAQLGLVAQCVEAGVSTRVFSVSLGGFDFHADEKPAQERILGELDAAVSSFVTRMARTDRGRDVVVMIYSEFGRRVRANASDGTDHGTASNVIVVGPQVHGGQLIGAQPSLTDLDDGDLKFSIDFRDVYATMLDGVLHTDPAPVLGGWDSTVRGLFR